MNGYSNDGYLPYPKGFATHAIHAGQDPEQWDSLSVIPPIVTSTTFKQYSPATPIKFEYGRSGNPTRNVLEECLAKLDGAKYGLTFSSGLGATSTIIGMLKSGDHVVCGDDVYGGTNRIFQQVALPLGITTSFADFTDLHDLESKITASTKLVWMETPTNPLLKVFDIAAVSKIAKKHKLLLAVDNTFLTSYLQRPLDFGADMVVYSLTKYMNGHSDVVMGAITLNDEQLHSRLRFLQNAMGIVPSPFDCYQTNRSLKTLDIRMQKHNRNALAIARFLETHPKVTQVLHPGMPSHPQHEIAKRQTSGHSGMISFYIDGDLTQSKKFLGDLKLFTLAESLGGYESLAELPSLMTHASVPEDQRKKLKITDNLIRISVGLEDTEDLIEDLNQALNAI